MSPIDFSTEELKVLFAVLTQEKFMLGDLNLLNPIAVKIQTHLKSLENHVGSAKVSTPKVPVKPKKN